MFIFCVLVWGSSYWFAKLQAGFAPAEFSLMMRLIIALIFFCGLYLLNNKPKKLLTFKQYIDLGVFGVCNFTLGYLFLYLSTNSLSSGLVIVIFSFKSILTPLLLTLKNKDKINIQLIYGATIAIIGIVLLMHDSLLVNKTSLLGVAYAFIGTMITSVGDLYSAKNTKNEIQPIYANLIGLCFAIPVMLLLNVKNWHYVFQLININYLGSILYLGIIASGVAWVFYLSLIKNIGAVRASYMVTIFPCVGCLMSIVFENMQLSISIVAGLCLEVIGLFVAFYRREH
jgi:drug/metabolite transporter (DMT)-like permease